MHKTESTIAEVQSVPTHAVAGGDAKLVEASNPSFERMVQLFRKVTGEYYASNRGVPFHFRWRGQRPYRFGNGEAEFEVDVKDATGISAMASLDPCPSLCSDD